MLRDKNLVPLARQHQHALALCVRIKRASPIPEPDLAAWQNEIAQHFRAEVRVHFLAEEQIVFPAARALGELIPLVDELRSEHVSLRGTFARAEAGSLSAAELRDFAERLSEHIRKEERQLFERMQKLMSGEELGGIGRRLDEALKESEQSCILPAKPRP